MTYEEYIQYHIRGDAGVEERMIASLCHHFALSGWDSFRFIYFYTMTYHIPSALKMLKDGERNMACLHFRTDRRYVRCNGAFFRLLKELTYDKYERYRLSGLHRKHTTRFEIGSISVDTQRIFSWKCIAMLFSPNGAMI